MTPQPDTNAPVRHPSDTPATLELRPLPWSAHCAAALRASRVPTAVILLSTRPGDPFNLLLEVARDSAEWERPGECTVVVRGTTVPSTLAAHCLPADAVRAVYVDLACEGLRGLALCLLTFWGVAAREPDNTLAVTAAFFAVDTRARVCHWRREVEP